jgi:serine/threonine-protein kinase
VNVIDFGQAESGEPYLVMEYLEGEDLDHRLRRVGRMQIEAVVHVVRQVASALNAAHDQGVVHRDLKPGNVFLLQIPGEPDFVKVLDFGISKMKAARTQLTSASAIMGTPNYMSPEQATGMLEEIDHRTDQWALACIAWESLLGRGPFVADEMAALMYQIINLDPHPLTIRVPGLPPAVEPVLRRALSKRPTERFASMREFSRALEAAASGRPADATPAPVALVPTAGATVGYGTSPVPPTPAPRDARKSDDDATDLLPRNRIKPIHAIVAAVCVLLLLGALLLWRSGPAPKPAPTQSPAISAKPAPAPTVTPLPVPAPPPPVAATPEPAPMPPALGGEAKPPVARRPQPALAPTGEPVSSPRAKQWHDPFADDPGVQPGAKKPKEPVTPPAAEPAPAPKPQRPKRHLIEEL